MGLQLLDQLLEKGCREYFQDFGQQVSGALVHDVAGARCGNACYYSLCAPAQLTAVEIGRGQFQSENIGLKMDGVLQGDHLLYQGQTPK